MDQKPQKSLKALLSVKHTNIDIQAMLVWLIVPFYDFYGFWSVAVNSIYKLQFLQRAKCIASAVLATAIPSVCQSVRHTPVLCQNDGT